MIWTLRKRFGHWCLTGNVYHVFDSFEEAIDWVETQRHQEPTA